MPQIRAQSNLGEVTENFPITTEDLNTTAFKLALEAAPNGNIIINSKGELFYLNLNAAKMFGYEREKLLGQPIEVLLPHRFRKDHPKFRFDFLVSPSVRPMGKGRELYGLKQNGEEFPIEIGLNPIVTKTATFVLAAVVDITERKKTQLELVKKTESLEKSFKDLNTFAYSVSHDLKAPLRGISNLTEILLMDYFKKATQEERENILLIQQGVIRMSDLIDGVLKYSKITQLEEPYDLIDAYQLVKDIIDSLKPPPHIKINIGLNLPKIKFYRTQMEQIFLNLIGNAIRFIDKKEGQIEIGYKDESKNHLFFVKDNGIGIPKKNMEQIFELFQTIAPKTDLQSTGIGLSIVKKIIEIYGGDIRVDSILEVGSTFYFTLPK